MQLCTLMSRVTVNNLLQYQEVSSVRLRQELSLPVIKSELEIMHMSVVHVEV